MGRKWLLIDANNVAHRAFHSTGGLTYDDIPTGVAYGVLRDVVNWTDHFETTQVAFCFDHGKQNRVAKFPYYKETRRKRRLNEAEADVYAAISAEIEKLRTDYLPALGYPNVFWQSGFEADDVIGSIVDFMDPADSAVIIGGDRDYYQLLRSNVDIYAPKRGPIVPYTKTKFKAEWGIKPTLWAYVKALAGCKGDDVTGIDGVGDITAAKYLAETLSSSTKAYKDITKFVRTQQYRDNLEMVQLPYPGTRPFVPAPHDPDDPDDPPDPDRWAALMDRLGIQSLGWETNADWRSGAALEGPRGK